MPGHVSDDATLLVRTLMLVIVIGVTFKARLAALAFFKTRKFGHGTPALGAVLPVCIRRYGWLARCIAPCHDVVVADRITGLLMSAVRRPGQAHRLLDCGQTIFRIRAVIGRR
jgi:hypothetical protein